MAAYGNRVVGVLLTGMGDDGADGMVRIHAAGGITIAESEQTAVVWGMPREAIERGAVDTVAPSGQIANHIRRALSKTGLVRPGGRENLSGGHRCVSQRYRRTWRSAMIEPIDPDGLRGMLAHAERVACANRVWTGCRL